MTSTVFSKIVAVSLSFGLVIGYARAEQLTGTLKRINDTGNIRLGVRDAFFPFSYLNEKKSYQGYSVDLCLKVVDAVQQRLGMKSLKVEMVPVTTRNRISLIADGTIDLSCDTAANNTERQNVVSFAPTMFVAATRLLSKKSSNIKTMDDMMGKTIVATSGTGGEREVIMLNKERKLGMKILTAKDHTESFRMVEAGQAVAFVMNDIVMLSLVAHSQAPDDYMLSTEALSFEPYAIIEPKNDPAFKKIVDTTLIALYQSGEINNIYIKWFQKPVPPNNINMNVPMSRQLKNVLAHPTDSGDPAAYQ